MGDLQAKLDAALLQLNLTNNTDSGMMINEGIKDTNTDEDIYNSSYEEDKDDTSMSGLSISSDDGDTAIVVGVRKTNKHQQKGSTASPFRKNRDSKKTFNFDSPSVANSREKTQINQGHAKP